MMIGLPCLKAMGPRESICGMVDHISRIESLKEAIE